MKLVNIFGMLKFIKKVKFVILNIIHFSCKTFYSHSSDQHGPTTTEGSNHGTDPVWWSEDGLSTGGAATHTHTTDRTEHSHGRTSHTVSTGDRLSMKQKGFLHFDGLVHNYFNNLILYTELQ